MLTTVRVKGVRPCDVSMIHQEIERMRETWEVILEGTKSFQELQQRLGQKGWGPKFRTNWEPKVLKCALQEDGTYSMEIEAPRTFVVDGPPSYFYGADRESIDKVDFRPSMKLYTKLYKLVGLM